AGLDRHDEAALLERQHLAGFAAGAFGKNQERVARLKRPGACIDRSHRRFFPAAVDWNEPAHPERAGENGDAIDLMFVKDVQPWMERGVEDRRIDVALMVAAIDRGA